MKTLTIIQAKQVWDVLVRLCGADHNSEQFIKYAQEPGYKEYRFGGNLGFGGKVYLEENKPPSVNCYQEDETKSKRIQINKANEALRILYKQWNSQQNYDR